MKIFSNVSLDRKSRRRSRLLWVALVTCVSILALWGLHYITNTETVNLDQSVRAQAPGKFVKLSDGLVHYQLIGSAEGPTIVLIPGATLPFFVWDPDRRSAGWGWISRPEVRLVWPWIF
jgi:hypothetical protein